MNKKAVLKNIELKNIDLGDRVREEYTNIPQLKQSIIDNGLIAPIAVKVYGDKFLLCAGGRRIHAYVDLYNEGKVIEWIACHVYPEDMDELKIREIELAENIDREDLTYVERARATEKVHLLYIEKHGAPSAINIEGQGVRETAALLGKSVGTVSANIQLAQAIETFPELAHCKNQTEAMKLLNKRKSEMATSILAKRISERQSMEGIDITRDKIVANYIVGDFFERVKVIPNNSINFIELDPPYGIDIKKLKKSNDKTGKNIEEYNEISLDHYPKFLEDVIKECDRTIIGNGWMVVWFGLQWLDLIKRLLTKYSFDFGHLPAVWYKRAGQTNWPEIYLANSYETFIYAKKGLGAIFNQGRSNVFEYKPVSSVNKIHPTERPIEMIEQVLATFCPPAGRVMVPFLGSGNTILAATNLGMESFGFDLSDKYKNGFSVRVNTSRPGEYKSYV